MLYAFLSGAHHYSGLYIFQVSRPYMYFTKYDPMVHIRTRRHVSIFDELCKEVGFEFAYLAKVT